MAAIEINPNETRNLTYCFAVLFQDSATLKELQNEHRLNFRRSLVSSLRPSPRRTGEERGAHSPNSGLVIEPKTEQVVHIFTRFGNSLVLKCP